MCYSTLVQWRRSVFVQDMQFLTDRMLEKVGDLRIDEPRIQLQEPREGTNMLSTRTLEICFFPVYFKWRLRIKGFSLEKVNNYHRVFQAGQQ